MDSPVLLEFASRKMVRLVRTAQDAAASNAPVLIGGENGTGRSVLAAAIHAWSPRRTQEFTPFACATLDERSVQSELAWALQTRLGGLLKRRADRYAESNDDARGARIISTTSRNLEAEATVGTFRADLLHLVDVVSIRIPPLRERPEYLAPLARHILRSHATLRGCAPLELKPQALAALAAYPWPGNVRDLVNVLDQAALVSRGSRIQVDDLPQCVRAAEPSPSGYYERTLCLRAVERQHIECIIASSGTLEKVASRPGIALTTLWRKRKRYEM